MRKSVTVRTSALSQTAITPPLLNAGRAGGRKRATFSTGTAESSAATAARCAILWDSAAALRFPRASVHIYPRSERSAVAVAADAPDAEFAASLALSAGEIIKALGL